MIFRRSTVLLFRLVAKLTCDGFQKWKQETRILINMGVAKELANGGSYGHENIHFTLEGQQWWSWYMAVRDSRQEWTLDWRNLTRFLERCYGLIT